MAHNRNKARDRRRAEHRIRRVARVLAPSYYNPLHRSYRTVEQNEQVKYMMEMLEMDGRRDIEQVKRCGSCGDSMDTVEGFHKDNRSPDGWAWQCKACRREKRKERTV